MSDDESKAVEAREQLIERIKANAGRMMTGLNARQRVGVDARLWRGMMEKHLELVTCTTLESIRMLEAVEQWADGEPLADAVTSRIIEHATGASDIARTTTFDDEAVSVAALAVGVAHPELAQQCELPTAPENADAVAHRMIVGIYDAAEVGGPLDEFRPLQDDLLAALAAQVDGAGSEAAAGGSHA